MGGLSFSLLKDKHAYLCWYVFNDSRLSHIIKSRIALVQHFLYLCTYFMATPGTVAFHTLGCKLNYSETSGLSRLFSQNGYAVASFADIADIYVVNTCSVTEGADRQCRQIVRQALRQNPEAKVIVTGCYAQLKPAEIAEIPGVNLVLGAAEKFRMLDYIDLIQNSGAKGLISSGEIKEVNTFESSYSFGDRTRSFLKVQDGCDYKCSFCTIPKARGKSRSDTVESVLNNARSIIEMGVKEIVLTGVNLGDFGNGTEVIEGSLPKKEALFIDLISELDQLLGEVRFRISSIEPNLLTEEIIEFVGGSNHFMPHFHIPLQSGSDSILKLMRRRYNTALYQSRIDAIRKHIPHACIGVDVIVGFPGETQKEFQETVDFIDQLEISYLHVFTYSERDDTAAVEMSGIVPVQERKRRNEVLRLLSEKKKRQHYLKHQGDIQEVLLENHKNKTLLTGFTPNYIKVIIPANGLTSNSMSLVRITGILNEPEIASTAELA